MFDPGLWVTGAAGITTVGYKVEVREPAEAVTALSHAPATSVLPPEQIALIWRRIWQLGKAVGSAGVGAEVEHLG
ncbi:MAG: hypothetical protein ABI206_08410 [Antricoccus sp.]